MKINYIVPQLNEAGGIQAFAKGVSKCLLDTKKVRTTLFNYNYDAPLWGSALVKISPHPLKPFLSKSLIIKHFQKKYELQSNSLCHCWHIDPALYLPSEVKFILTVHGLEILKSAINKSWYRSQYAPLAIQRAAAITCDSIYTKQLLFSSFENVDQSKVHVVYPPVDADKFISKSKRKNRQTYIVGTLCRLVGRKNVPRIIEALDILQTKLPDFVFRLAGDGPEREHLLSLLKKSSFKWEYLGKISEEEKINHFYPELDVFVMPTLVSDEDVEGFGIVYLEANASGVPVIAAKSGGAGEAICDRVSGFMVDPNDPSGIAEKIYHTLKDQPFEIKKIQAWAKKFDMNIIANQFYEIYSSIKL